MKKILLLGGSLYLLPVIEEAHRLGLYVITCDYLPDNIAHKYSDKYVNVSIIEKDLVLKKAIELNIDGIMSFACDQVVVTAAYVAEKMNLPSAGSLEAISVLQNKGKFRSFLRDNGFNVPNFKVYKDANAPLLESDFFQWPVIVKPTDSAGSKGVKRVDSKDCLREAIDNAIINSKSGEFIIEDFLEQKGYSSDCDSFSIDGRMVFWGFNCQHFDKHANNPYTPSGYSWPTSISDKNINILKSEIQRLLSLLNLKTSVYNVEVRECTNGKPYIMEFTPRGGGNRLSEMLELGTGTSIIGNAVRAAVGLQLIPIVTHPMKDGLVEVILHSNESGFFDSVIIDDCIKDRVIECKLWIKSGDIVGDFTGANKAIGTLVVQFDSKKEANCFAENVSKYVKIRLSKTL